MRSKQDGILIPANDSNLATFLEQDLRVKRINDVRSWLWACGRLMPPRALHHQLVLSREIVVTEDPELHLIWAAPNSGGRRMHIKPLPEYLLDLAFWNDHIIPHGEPDVAKCARGFLFSYCALIAHPIDFRIAHGKGLLPKALTWRDWKTLAGEIVDGHRYAAVNPRYWYGELRLGRLNKVYRFRKGHLLLGYSDVTGYAVYGDLIRDNYASLVAMLSYVVIVLAALQVGLATKRLSSNSTFQAVSYGLTVFSIITPLLSILAIILFALIWIVSNWRATIRFQEKRLESMGVKPFWEDENKPLKRARTGAAASSNALLPGG